MIAEKIYTYEDYLKKEERVELINGEFYDMSPSPYPKHQRVVSRLWHELFRNLDCKNSEKEDKCEVYISPIDWKIDDRNVVQPDVAIFCEETDKQYFSKTPPVVVEVLSKATAKKDISIKYELYERNGVKYYLIVDPNNEIADIFKLKNDKFELIGKLSRDKEIELEWDGCKSKIDFKNVYN